MSLYRVSCDDTPVVAPYEADDDRSAASQAQSLSADTWTGLRIWCLERRDGEQWRPVLVWVPRIKFSLHVTTEERPAVARDGEP